MKNTQKRSSIRTSLLKFIIQQGLSVREFNDYAKRTRLSDRNNLIKVESHVNLWRKYNWI